MILLLLSNFVDKQFYERCKKSFEKSVNEKLVWVIDHKPLAWNSVIIGCSILKIETTFSYLSIKHNQPPTVLRWLISNSINFLQLLAYKSIHIKPENTIVFWGFVQLTYSWKKFRLLEFEAFERKPQSSINASSSAPSKSQTIHGNIITAD